MSTTETLLLDPGLRDAAERKAAELGLNFHEFALAALADKINGKTTAAERRLAAKVSELAAKVAELEYAVASPAERLAADTEAEAEFARLVQHATPRAPARPAAIQRATGWQYRRVARRLAALVAAGYATRLAEGCYVAAAGMDILEGMEATRGRIYALNEEASRARRDVNGTTPAPASPVAPAEATGPSEGKNAATRRGGIAGARERAAEVGAPLVAARDVPRRGATAVFQEPGAAKVVTAPVPEVPKQGRQHAVNCKCGVCKPKAAK